MAVMYYNPALPPPKLGPEYAIEPKNYSTKVYVPVTIPYPNFGLV